MKRKRCAEVQIISNLKKHETSTSVADTARRYRIVENNVYHCSKSTFGGKDTRMAEDADETVQDLLMKTEYLEHGLYRVHGLGEKMIAHKHSLPVARQRALPNLPRSTFDNVPGPGSDKGLELMVLTDRRHLPRPPFYSSRRIRDWLLIKGARPTVSRCGA